MGGGPDHAQTGGGDWRRRVCWIGGGSGSGKTTLARRLASEFGLEVYDTDAAMADHARRLDARSAPLLHEFLGMTMDERWVTRPAEEMFETFHWYAGEGFALVARDLREIARRSIVVVEGFRLLPRLVAPYLLDRRSAVWLLPTPMLRQRVFEHRPSTRAIVDATSDPSRALANLLERDRMFTDAVRRETIELGLATVDVDVEDSEVVASARVRECLLLPDGCVSPYSS